MDVQTQLAEDFQKIDMMESLEKDEIVNTFAEILANLCNLDLALGEVDEKLTNVEGKFMDGKSLFSSHPARIGFIVAATNLIVGKIGRDKSKEMSEKSFKLFNKNCILVAERILELKDNEKEINEFLAFDVLNELIRGLPKNKVGDIERSGFKNVFNELLQEEFEIKTLEPYWRQI